MQVRLLEDGLSEEVASLVEIVARLPSADQRRILRIVDLLLRAPRDARRRTQQMLRALVDSGPASKNECVTCVDEIIDYLEHRLVGPLPDAPDATLFSSRH
jgi:hypothetical protein